MKFRLSIASFLEVVNNAALALPQKSTDFRHENLVLTLDKKNLSISATDGDILLDTNIQVETGDKGTVSIQAKKLQDILRNMYNTDADFKAEKKGDGNGDATFSIKTDKGNYKIAASLDKVDKEEDKLKVDYEFKLPATELRNLTDKTMFAASTDDMRPAMMGVLFEIDGESIRTVATDGHRLVKFIKKVKTGVKEKSKFIIPNRVMTILQKITSGEEGDVTMAVDSENSRIKFSFGETQLVASLINENYPNYEAVIPLENDKKMLVNRSAIQSTVKRISRFASGGQIRFSVAKGELKVWAQNNDEGSEADEQVVCDYSSDSLTIGFNAKFVEDALNHLDSQEVTFEFSSPTRATIIKPKDEDKAAEELLMLVMPVRINN
jgi:DNA polymerase-3 subunit beta